MKASWVLTIVFIVFCVICFIEKQKLSQKENIISSDAIRSINRIILVTLIAVLIALFYLDKKR